MDRDFLMGFFWKIQLIGTEISAHLKLREAWLLLKVLRIYVILKKYIKEHPDK